MSYFILRFVRDYMRYKDEIQCAAKEVVDMIREDAKKLAPHDNGNFYTLHIRRGDFQFKVIILLSMFQTIYIIIPVCSLSVYIYYFLQLFAIIIIVSVGKARSRKNTFQPAIS